MKSILNDLRLGFRSLLRSPVFTLVAVLTLALSIGMNAGIFSVLNSLLLRPYPFPHGDEMAVVRMINAPRDLTDVDVSLADFADFRQGTRAFRAMALVSTTEMNLTGGERPVRVEGARATASLFDVVGGQPLLGRTFTLHEDRPGAGKVAVLSEGLWRRAFASSPEVLDSKIQLDGEPHTVIGVVPLSAQFPDPKDAEVFVPIARQPEDEARSNRSYFMLGHLAPGATAAQAQLEMAAVAERLGATYPDTNRHWSVRVEMLRDYLTDDLETLLLLLFLVVGFVLLIASVNVANLSIQRGLVRQRMLAVRTALGASRGRLFQSLILESVLVASIAAVGGLFVTWAFLELIRSQIPAGELESYLQGFSMDGRVVFYLVVVSLLTVLVFGLAPALRFSRPDLVASLKEGGGKASSGVGQARFRNALTVLEIGLSVAAVICAVLMLRSYQSLQAVDPGFEPDDLLTVSLSLPDAQYGEEEQRREFYRRALERVGALPGVEAVSAGSHLPVGDWTYTYARLEGQSDEEQRTNPLVGLQMVSGNYFDTLRQPLVRGRTFRPSDDFGTPLVAVVNEELVRMMWPDADTPLGQRIQLSASRLVLGEPTWATVVGVVGDTLHLGLNDEADPDVYLSYNQVPLWDMDLYVRTAGEPLAVAPKVQNELQQVDPAMPVEEIATMHHVLDLSLWVERASGVVFALFAALALVLAAVGVYGTIGYSVAQRTQEIGIRMAIGAARRDIQRMIILQAARLVTLGIVIGFLLAYGTVQLTSSLLYGIEGEEPTLFLLVAVILASVALAASYLPARRASRLDPQVALQTE